MKIRCKINQYNSDNSRIESIKHTNTKWMEEEANVFAMCLLIPEKAIKQDLANGVDLGNGEAMKMLCKKYDVTLTTMTMRISLLNLKYKK